MLAQDKKGKQHTILDRARSRLGIASTPAVAAPNLPILQTLR